MSLGRIDDGQLVSFDGLQGIDRGMNRADHLSRTGGHGAQRQCRIPQQTDRLLGVDRHGIHGFMIVEQAFVNKREEQEIC